MLQRLLGFAVVFIGVCIGAGGAAAKIPIPCTGEKIVKVAALPKIDAFALSGGQHLDLGWLYQGCFSGKWVGTFGASDRYVTWKNGMLPDILAASGMKAMPSEPGVFWGLRNAPGQFWVEWMCIVLGSAAIVSKVRGLKTAPSTEHREPATEHREPATVPRERAIEQGQSGLAQETTRPSQSAYDAALNAAIAERAKTARTAARAEPRPRASNAPPVAPPRRPARTITAGPTRALSKGAAPAFGRRA